MKKDNLILIGFMGTGKTCLGKKFAREYGYQFVDTDMLIEEREKRKIKDIFSESGEEYFRDLETELVRECLPKLDHTVISVGGGLPMREINRELLKQAGYVVHLNTSLTETIRRLSGDTERPLLKADDAEKRIRELYEKRLPIYKAGADCVLATDGNSSSQTVKRLHEIFMKKEC